MHRRAAKFAVLFAAFDALAFVVLLFAAADAEFEFGAAVLEIDGQGNECGAALLGLGGETVDLALVCQEFALAEGVVANGGLVVGIDVAAVEDQLPPLDASIGFSKLAAAQAQGLDLATQQRDAAFHLGGDEIVVQGLAVGDARIEIGVRAVGHRLYCIVLEADWARFLIQGETAAETVKSETRNSNPIRSLSNETSGPAVCLRIRISGF